MPRYTEREMGRSERFHRYTHVSAEVGLRAHREAMRGGVPDSGEVESITPDWLLAIMLDPEVLAHLMADREIDVGAVRRRRAALRNIQPQREPPGTAPSERRATVGKVSPNIHPVFESLMRWALSDEPDTEVQKWRSHSDLQMYMSTMPPDAEDDPWPPERVRAGVYRLAVMRKMFELIIEHDGDAARAALTDLRLTELDFQRCVDKLATKYTLDFTYRSAN